MKITGLLVPIVTPFDSNDQIDFSALKTLINTLIDSGVSGIIACGTTGEYYALNADERHKLMAFIAETVGDRALWVTQLSHTGLGGPLHDSESGLGIGLIAHVTEKD